MGDFGEPGGAWQSIMRAALLGGLGIATCTCKYANAPGEQLNLLHEPDCPIHIAASRAVKILGKTEREKSSR